MRWRVSNPVHVSCLSMVGRGVHVTCHWAVYTTTTMPWHRYQLAVVVMYGGQMAVVASW